MERIKAKIAVAVQENRVFFVKNISRSVMKKREKIPIKHAINIFPGEKTMAELKSREIYCKHEINIIIKVFILTLA